MPALALGLRSLYRPPATRAEAGPAVSRRAGWAALAWRAAGTAAGGYLLLLAVVVAYYYTVSRAGPGFLKDAATGTALLIGLAAPVLAAASWLDERVRRRRARRPASGDRPAPQEATMARRPLAGYLAWAVLFGALFAWEGLALAGAAGVPSLSHVVGRVTRYPAGRWALSGLWLWAGWRMFARAPR
jgi:hypothetical protein